jgi:hypothetical protein
VGLNSLINKKGEKAMTSHKLSDVEIQVRVVPKHLRWPENGSSVVWTKAHTCVDALQKLVRSLDLACVEAEQSHELSAGAVARRRVELCEQALRKLVNFSAFEIAEKALSENIVAMERRSDRDPEQVQMLQELTQALHDLREGIEATRCMVLERCKMREGAVLKSA